MIHPRSIFSEVSFLRAIYFRPEIILRSPGRCFLRHKSSTVGSCTSAAGQATLTSAAVRSGEPAVTN